MRAKRTGTRRRAAWQGAFACLLIGTSCTMLSQPALGAATVPGAPTNVTATPGNGSITATWTAPANDGGSPLTDYLICAYGPGGTCQQPSATSTTTTITGLTNGTSYAILLAAQNAVGYGPTGTSPTATPVFDPAGINYLPAEVDAIEQAQLADGAIEPATGSPTLDPYGAMYGAAGLARFAQLTGNTQAAQDAWAALQWYAAAQDPTTGAVPAYTVTNGTLQTPVESDSLDATAGVFLVAVDNYWAATSNRSQLTNLQPNIQVAVNAITSLQQPDGLIYDRPDWPVAYLMDNAEAYGGLTAAQHLATTLGDAALATQAANAASALATAWNTSMWDQGGMTNGFSYAYNNGIQPTSWSYFSPDSLAQAWAVAYGLATPSHATAIMNNFTADWTQWDQPAADVLNEPGTTQPAGYAPLVACALTAIGQDSAAVTGTNAIAAAAINAATINAGAYTTGDAAQLIIATSGETLVP